jgi:hypothetical protein
MYFYFVKLLLEQKINTRVLWNLEYLDFSGLGTHRCLGDSKNLFKIIIVSQSLARAFFVFALPGGTLSRLRFRALFWTFILALLPSRSFFSRKYFRTSCFLRSFALVRIYKYTLQEKESQDRTERAGRAGQGETG